MDEEDLGGNDSSDEDYKPDQQELPSEEESDGEPEDDGNVSGGDEAELCGAGKKRGRSSNKQRSKANKRTRVTTEDRSSEVRDEGTVTVAVNEEDSKKKTDSLWADFLKDTKTSSSTAIVKETSDGASNNSSSDTTGAGDNSKTVTVYEFAGEQVMVPTAAVPAAAAASTSSRTRGGGGGGRGGLSSVLNQLGKKQKISTLEKSKLDWDRFKQDENIVDELSAHNKGRHGYLERQDFLQRADQRQFELEKELRTKHRSHRL